MKKKIKDLTITEVNNLCQKQDSCKECFMFDYHTQNCGAPITFDIELLETEVEVDE